MKRELSVNEIAKRVKGTVVGDGAFLVTTLCPLEEPARGGISFIRENSEERIKKEISRSREVAYLVSNTVSPDALTGLGTAILVENPYDALVSLIPHFLPPLSPIAGVSPKADVHPTARLGKDVSVGAFSVIGEGCEIGAGTVIHPHVVLYAGVTIGENSVLHSGVIVREGSRIGAHSILQNGVVIGADGFGYVPDAALGLRAIPQVGTVVLADRVEIGANSCVDRATLGTTRIGTGSKLDNLVQVGHNTHIGSYSIVCGHVGIAGSCSIGDGVVIGGGSGVGDHRKIGHKVRVGGMSGVSEDIPTAGDYLGYPAVPASLWRRNSVLYRELPTLIRTIKKALNIKGRE